jgi:hypothetical protein
MKTKPDRGRKVKGGWPNSLTRSEYIRHEVILYAEIPDDCLTVLVEDAYQNAKESLLELTQTPRAAWDTDHAREQEAEYEAWCLALGKTVLAMWGLGFSWEPADEPEVIGEDDAA